jgi:hypothetical protein
MGNEAATVVTLVLVGGGLPECAADVELVVVGFVFWLARRGASRIARPFLASGRGRIRRGRGLALGLGLGAGEDLGVRVRVIVTFSAEAQAVTEHEFLRVVLVGKERVQWHAQGAQLIEAAKVFTALAMHERGLGLTLA